MYMHVKQSVFQYSDGWKQTGQHRDASQGKQTVISNLRQVFYKMNPTGPLYWATLVKADSRIKDRFKADGGIWSEDSHYSSEMCVISHRH